MWFAILGILALSAIGGMVYMVRRFHRVPLLTALAEKHRFLSWLLAAVPPALFMLCHFSPSRSPAANRITAPAMIHAVLVF